MTLTLPPDYVPTENEEYMNPNQLEYFRLKLVHWKEELLQESAVTLQDLRETDLKEADLNDRASTETDQFLELRTRDRMRKLIKKIDEALKRVADGTYGFCEETGEPIGIKRLEARPVTTLCIEAQERHERKEKTQADDNSKYNK